MIRKVLGIFRKTIIVVLTLAAVGTVLCGVIPQTNPLTWTVYGTPSHDLRMIVGGDTMAVVAVNKDLLPPSSPPSGYLLFNFVEPASHFRSTGPYVSNLNSHNAFKSELHSGAVIRVPHARFSAVIEAGFLKPEELQLSIGRGGRSTIDVLAVLSESP